MTNVIDDRAALARRLLGRGRPRRETPAFPRVPDGTALPLTSPQARIWFFTQRFPESAEYNLFDRVDFSRAPERAVFVAAIRTLMSRYDVLRTRIELVDGVPMQRTCRGLDAPVEWIDLSAAAPEVADQQATEILAAAARQPLRVDTAPMFRVVVVALPGGRATAAFGFHHAILDLTGVSALLAELATVLAGGELPAPPVQFLDHLAARPSSGGGAAARARDLDHWLTTLGGELPVLALPADRPRPVESSRRGRVIRFAGDAALTAGVRAFATATGVSTHVVLLAAYATLLSRLTGQRDVVVGTPLSGRDDAVTERIVGCFVTPAPVRVDLVGAPTFGDVVRLTQRMLLDAQDHQSVPFEEVVIALAPARLPGANPVYQTIFGSQTATELVAGAHGMGQPRMLDTGSALADLAMSVTEHPDALDGLLEFATDLVEECTARRWASMYIEQLTLLTARPDEPVASLPLIGDVECTRIVRDLNPHVRPEIGYRTLAEPFEEQARRTPDAEALVAEGERLTYRELNERANRMARHLRAEGVRPGDVVALCLERSVDMVVALYAVPKTGAAYVPLDPELPPDRLRFMLEDTEPSLVLADDTSAASVPEGPWRVESVSRPERWAGESAADLGLDVPEGAPAYLLYTSGSTGRPKAVAYPVDGAVANILWLQEQYTLGRDDANILKTSYGFDVSTWEIYWPLYVGARLVVARPGGQRDPQYLVELVEKHGVTILFFVPTMMQVFLDHVPQGGCPTLTWALCGGEAVKPRLRDEFYERFDAMLINCCGPTEAGTVVEGVIPREPGAPVVPLGRPCGNFRLYVLDADGGVLPVGMPGEMYVGGDIGVAHGYHRRPGLTADRFVPDPWGPPGSRMYRTGDLCRYRADGVVEHLGRIGRQIKIRGMRIEPAEIEAVLAEHPAVRSCVAIAPEHLDGRIVAFVTAAGPGELPLADIDRHARRLLPAHMRPAALVPVDAIPFTVNGKADEAALLAVLAARTTTADTEGAAEDAGERAPASGLERALLRIYRDVLGSGSIGVEDGFFEVGGHSLLVFRLISACTERLGRTPSVSDIFAAPTVRDLAACLESADHGRERCLVPLAPNPGSPVVVLVHGAGGSALPFRAVAAALEEEFDVWGLQSVADGGPEPEDLPAVAARYTAAVDEVRGATPVVLAGWSVGGCVALEMARHWQERGVEVVATIMLDTFLPPGAAGPDEATARAFFAGLDLMGGEPGAATDPAVATALERFRALFTGHLPGPYDGAVHLFTAAEPMRDAVAALPARLVDGDRGWGALLDDLHTGVVPGGHFTLVAPEHAAALGAAIAAVAESHLQYEEI